MSSNKRKGRLDKGTTEFVGFGAFASAAPTSTSTSAPSSSSSSSLSWSPVYTGPHDTLQVCFQRLRQKKRDPVTKAKAWRELCVFFADTEVPKRQQVDALAHTVWLLHHQHLDDQPHVRAATLVALAAAQKRLPKAWKGLVGTNNGDGGGSSSSSSVKALELQGMLWCCRCDPNQEVVAQTEWIEGKAADDWISWRGLWAYATKILGYGRARKMHDDLFGSKQHQQQQGNPNKKKDQSAKTNKTKNQSEMAAAPAVLSETDREKMEERFERIVGTVLSGLELWFRTESSKTQKQSDQDGDNGKPDGTIIWKYMTSSKVSFRRKTYSLAMVICQHASNWIPQGTKFTESILPAVLAQEKEAVNIPMLLELLLVVYTTLGTSKSNHRNNIVVVTPPLMIKHLTKTFKKACYGASAVEWTPAVLPLVVSMCSHRSSESDDQQQLSTAADVVTLVTSLWEGNDAAIGSRDALAIGSAVAECAGYFLLRREGEDAESASLATLGDDNARQLGQLWLHALELYLATTTEARNVAEDENLGTILHKTVHKLDHASYDRPNCAVFSIRDWFWSEFADTVLKEEEVSSKRFKGLIRSNERSGGEESHLVDTVRRKFHAILKQYQSASFRVPSWESYQVLVSCLKFSGDVSAIFSTAMPSQTGDVYDEDDTQTTSLERFLLNDVLRWLVIHSSELETTNVSSSTVDRAALALLDFQLLGICLASVLSPLKQKSLWETVLQELMRADCHLGVLTDGLRVLQKEQVGDVLKSEYLEKLCVERGKLANDVGIDEDDFKEGDDGDDDKHDEEGSLEKFLTFCLGLDLTTDSSLLVGKRVVSELVNVVVSSTSSSSKKRTKSILRSLLRLAKHESISTKMITTEEVIAIVLHAWKLGGEIWQKWAVPILMQDQGLFCEVTTRAFAQVVESLSWAISDKTQDAFAEPWKPCEIWALKASRMLKLQGSIDTSALSSVGLADLVLWQSAMDGDEAVSLRLFWCLTCFLAQFDSEADRRRLVLKSIDNGTGEMDIQFFSKVLVGLSRTGDLDKRYSIKSKSRMTGLLALLGNDCLNQISLKAIIEESMGLFDSGNAARAEKVVSVLSGLCGLLFDDYLSVVKGGQDDLVDAAQVAPGDHLWYVVNPEDGTTRELAEIVKVHTDDFPRLYFSIRIHKEIAEEQRERQTVADRLRKSDGSSLRGLDSISKEEQKLRSKIGASLFTRIVKKFLCLNEETELAKPAADVLSIIIGQCGLFGKGGLGSLRFDIFQLVTSLQDAVLGHLDSGSLEKASGVLDVLSRSFGSLSECIKLLRFDPSLSVTKIVHVFSDESFDDIDAAKSALRWLIPATSSVDDNDTVQSAIEIGYGLIAKLLPSPSDTNFALSCFGAIETFESLVAARGIHPSEALEREMLSKLVYSFSSNSCIDNDERRPHWLVSSDLIEPPGPSTAAKISSCLSTLPGSSLTLLSAAARQQTTGLMNALLDTEKRWLAFRLLYQASGLDTPLFTEDDELDVFEGTAKLLETWRKDLMEEESEELEDDILIVQEWLPEPVMVELESWVDDDQYFVDEEEHGDETVPIQRMIMWLTVLNYLESAASHDVRNRSGFASYIQHCGAARFILNAALLHAPIDSTPTSPDSFQVEDILRDESKLDVSTLAGLVFFRTVEVFPTMSKTWWDEECPKSLSSAVSKFVQTTVSPETLRRELARINKATNVGEMSVSGSTVSRIVTATYVQDECTLSLVVTIPPNFPLRNVDVDGRKTHGVPERRWKRWALQIRTMLNSQDGTLLDALMLWKQNVDKEFEGVEPCPVCYSVLSVKQHELPNLQCKTCGNCFHSSCLYQWFRSSGKSQCVLCQQPWSGTRIQ